MVKAVIFDMDGLMFDTERLNLEGWQQAGRSFGYEIPAELVRECIGMTAPETKRRMQARFGKDFDFDAIRSERIRYVGNLIETDGTPAKPGLRKLLEYLRQRGIKTAIASSSDRRFIDFYLDNAALGHRFDEIVSGDLVERSKPAPDIFILALERLSLPADQCLVLEDSYNGIRAAHSAGIRVVMVPDLLLPTPEVEKLLFRRLDSLDQVIGLLKELKVKELEAENSGEKKR